MNAQTVRLYSPAEYLALEQASTERHEYLRGEVWAMSGGTYEHSFMAGQVIQAVGAALKGKPCVVLTSDFRIRVESTDLFTYPDVSVVCGKRQVSALDANSLLNPTVLFEVLSESTERYDRGAKFAHYQRIESLKEYVLVSQDRKLIEVYRRGEGETWLYHPWREGSHVELHSLGITLDLDALYFDPTA